VAVAAVLLASACPQEPDPRLIAAAHDPRAAAARLAHPDQRDLALDELSKLPLDRARLALPELIALYRETGKADHLQALSRFDDPRVRPLFVEALARWKLDRARTLVAVRTSADWKAREATGALMAITTTALPPADRNNEVRLEAVRALLRIGDPGMVPALITLLSAPVGQ
jgi:HEAT repeat protein